MLHRFPSLDPTFASRFQIGWEDKAVLRVLVCPNSDFRVFEACQDDTPGSEIKQKPAVCGGTGDKIGCLKPRIALYFCFSRLTPCDTTTPFALIAPSVEKRT
jgi:hypothetical protein